MPTTKCDTSRNHARGLRGGRPRREGFVIGHDKVSVREKSVVQPIRPSVIPTLAFAQVTYHISRAGIEETYLTCVAPRERPTQTLCGNPIGDRFCQVR